MLYAIIPEDTPGTLEQRISNRAAHLARLDALQSQGRLILAGPCPAIDSPTPGPAGFSGSLIVAEFGSLAEAEAWAQEDPYVSGGVYRAVIVKPFVQVYPR